MSPPSRHAYSTLVTGNTLHANADKPLFPIKPLHPQHSQHTPQLSINLNNGPQLPLSSTPRLSEEQQCRFQRLSAVQPSKRIQSEGGVTELWDENENQFQCAGVAATKNTIKPNGLSLPNYHSSPRLVFIESGQGFIGVTFPGCPETYQASEQKQQGSLGDSHQKVRRIRQGDLIVLPAGVAHWSYNDGNQNLVAVSINDLTHVSNQLDQKFRAFYLAGEVPQQGEGQKTFQNIFKGFNQDLIAEAFNISPETVQRLQAQQEKRGLIVIARERMSFITSEEEQGSRQQSDNGLEETLCNVDIRASLEDRRDADVYSRQAGKINVVDANKLPILKNLDLSAERGNLYPNAIISPNWEAQGHRIVYVTKGEAQVEIVSHTGEALMSNRVSQGDMFVVPQFFASTTKAGNNGFEWVAFKTTGSPMRSSLAGYTSVIRAMPLQVIANAYQISPKQAQGLKTNRGGQSILLSPGGRQS